MGINKFERELKVQLEKRRIQPSEESWEKLNARLKGKNQWAVNRKWWWGATAAAVAVVMLSVFLFNLDPNSPRLVEEPVKEEFQKPSPQKTFEAPVEITSDEKEEELLKTLDEKNQAAEIASTSEEKKAVLEEKTTPEEFIIQEEIVLSPPQESNSDFSEEIEELLATVNQKEGAGNTVSDAEIDALLAEAAAEIQQKRSPLKTPEIDAESLLAEVEDEIYQSFKEKIFIVLKEGFVKARTAVANRNN